MRRLPFTLILLPGGELRGTVDVRGRASDGAGWIVRIDAHGPKGHVSEVTIASSARVLELTGTDLEAFEVS